MTERLLTARDRLAMLSPDLLEFVEEIVDERVAAALAELPMSSPVPPWLTLEQAAERLGCSVDAVRMRAKRGRLKSRHEGRRVYVSRESVDGLA